MIESADARQQTRRILRTAAIELRQMAEREPAIADELRHLARELETDADDLLNNSQDLIAPT